MVENTDFITEFGFRVKVVLKFVPNLTSVPSHITFCIQLHGSEKYTLLLLIWLRSNGSTDWDQIAAESV